MASSIQAEFSATALDVTTFSKDSGPPLLRRSRVVVRSREREVSIALPTFRTSSQPDYLFFLRVALRVLKSTNEPAAMGTMIAAVRMEIEVVLPATTWREMPKNAYASSAKEP